MFIKTTIDHFCKLIKSQNDRPHLVFDDVLIVLIDWTPAWVHGKRGIQYLNGCSYFMSYNYSIYIWVFWAFLWYIILFCWCSEWFMFYMIFALQVVTSLPDITSFCPDVQPCLFCICWTKHYVPHPQFKYDSVKERQVVGKGKRMEQPRFTPCFYS